MAINMTYTLTLPDEINDELRSFVDKTGLALDDVVAACIDLTLNDPTQSTAKRVFKRANSLKLSRIVEKFPAPRVANDEGEETEV